MANNELQFFGRRLETEMMELRHSLKFILHQNVNARFRNGSGEGLHCCSYRRKYLISSWVVLQNLCAVALNPPYYSGYGGILAQSLIDSVYTLSRRLESEGFAYMRATRYIGKYIWQVHWHCDLCP